MRRLVMAGALACSAPAYAAEPDAFVAWAQSHAAALPECSGEANAADFGAFDPIVGTAQVVAFGEPTHGAHEPLAMRNCLFRHLVERQGFTAIAIESGLAESRALQAYVAGGPGDARALARSSLTWGFWRFGENVELLEWMHRFNADPLHATKIRFYGIDMSGGDASGEWPRARITLEQSLDFLERAAPERSRAVRVTLGAFKDRFTLSSYRAMKPGEKRALRMAINDVIRFYASNRKTLALGANPADFAWEERCAVLARQIEAAFRVSRASDSGEDLQPDDWQASAARDAAMAENLRWVMGREGPTGRILLFAHDGHIVNESARGGEWTVFRHPPASMGQHLRAALGNRLRIIASAAVNIDPRLGGTATPLGSVDRALADVAARTGKLAFVLDIRKPNNGVTSQWLKRNQSIMTNLTTNSLLTPHRAIDAVVFLRSLTPSQSPRPGKAVTGGNP